MTTITVDSNTYHLYIDYESITRQFEIVEGNNKGTAITGTAIRDILGTSYTYEMTVKPDPNYISDYDSFYEVISAPTDYHTVTLPYGQSTIQFKAQIISGDDVYYGNNGGTLDWGALKVTFKPYELQRV